MTKPCIICVAITGSVPTKDDNPAVPITVSEQIESTQEAFEAGAPGDIANRGAVQIPAIGTVRCVDIGMCVQPEHKQRAIDQAAGR